MLRNLDIRQILISLPVLLISLTVHELCHGFMAYKLGDSTAKYDGRLSLNPIKHIDPIGLLCILLVGFGWAKPVMVNPRNLKNPKVDMGLIAAAGPISNFLLAMVVLLIYYPLAVSGATLLTPGVTNIVFEVLMRFCTLNIVLGIFNLIPFPPLDGSKIFAGLIPDRIYYKLPPIGRYSMIILLILVWTGAIGYILEPLTRTAFSLLVTLARTVYFWL